MGFLNNAKADAADAVAAGQPERAAEIVFHAAMEGPGTFEENLSALAAELPEENR